MSTPTTENIPLRIAVLYLILSILWITLSDSLLAALVSPAEYPTAFAYGQTIKGWGFVLATAVFLYILLRRWLWRLRDETHVRRKTEQDLQSLMLATPLAVVKIDPDGIVQYWNKPAEEMFGWTAAEAIGKPMPFVADENQAQSAVLRQRVMSGESFIGVDLQRVRKDGSPIAVNLSTAPVRNSDGEIVGILGIVKDISERKKAEAELKAQQRQLYQIHQILDFHIQNSPLAVIEWDKEFRIIRWSGQAEKMFGWTEAEMKARKPNDWPFSHEDDRAAVRKVMADLLLGATPHNLSVNRNYTRSGEVLCCEWYNSALLDDDNQLVSILSLVHDITERKQAEEQLRALNAELERRVAERTAQLEAKNKELETFAYSVSHDLKAPLRGIDGYGRLLQEEHTAVLNEEGQIFLRNIRQATQQMGRLIDDLLAYSRLERRDIRPAPINLAALVGGLLAEQQETIAARSVKINQINLDIAIQTDPDALSMALRNLIDNALKFSKETPAPAIEIGCRQTEESVQLWVRDNGIGFDPKFITRIFEIFQRLHRAEDYPGTGIGLALARKAAERMNGAAWAESEPGQGATFYLQIPKEG
jgi:PAS domain S-box-containing protein